VIQTHAPVLPKAYLVIARDSSLKYYYAHAFPVVTLPALPTLNNTEDGLKLYSDTGVLLDSMYYSATGSVFSAGISLERINAGALWTQGNWGVAATRYRATPGYINSLTPKLNDCRMTALRSTPQYPAKGDSIRVEADITRTDGAELLSGYVRFSFRQSNGDSSSQFIPVQISRTHPVVTLQPPRAVLLIGDSITVTANIFFTDDPDTSNDYQTITVRSGIPRGGVVINEIMFDPAPGQPEWIEMYNASADPVNLRQWKIADNAPQSNYATLTSENYYLDAGKYLVVARDSLPGFSEPYLIAAFGALNNDSDKIFLRDNRDALIDSAGYTGSQFISRGRSIERVTRDDGSITWSLSI
jgi:hypothetical protein